MLVKHGTVCFIVSQGKVLLALIEYAPGNQKWNGIGGVVNQDESPEQAVVREIGEETRLVVSERDLKNRGEIYLSNLVLHIFTTDNWSGELKAIDPTIQELRWFGFDDIPYSEMWEGNGEWLPKVLSGGSV